MTSGRPPENTELMLHANDVHICDVQKIRRAQVRSEVLLRNLEADLCRVIIAPCDIIHRHNQTLRSREFFGDSATQVCGKRGDAALPWKIVPKKSDFANGGWGLHESCATGEWPIEQLLH